MVCSQWQAREPSSVPLRVGRHVGASIQLVAREGTHATLRMPSGEMRMVDVRCRATVGVQGLSTEDFALTRTGETGSWLGQVHQGRGIGTRMRQAICAFAFDHLGAVEVTSAAFLDNPASLAVSRKVGYRPNGARREKRRDGEVALSQKLVLTAADLVRGDPLEVEGAADLRRFLELPDPD